LETKKRKHVWERYLTYARTEAALEIETASAGSGRAVSTNVFPDWSTQVQGPIRRGLLARKVFPYSRHGGSGDPLQNVATTGLGWRNSGARRSEVYA
jgi:hypothetical protein